MDDLRHRLGIYRLSYSSWILGGLVLLVFIGEKLLEGREERSWNFALFTFAILGIWVARMGSAVARLLRNQNERLERLEERVGRLQEERPHSSPSSPRPPDEQRETL